MKKTYKPRLHQILRLILLLLTLAVCTGCTPEDRTMLLPKAQSAEEESEGTDPARDFTVKKIYTYSYDTSELLLKSAYLKGCPENEIHITALDEIQEENQFVYRQVDYRYGFHDTLSEYSRFWETGDDPQAEAAKDTLLLDSLLPSPDGKQLLVYLRSADWNTRAVWLQTLGAENPWLLYEGSSEEYGPMTGAFSPNGHWVTFDSAGFSTGDDYMVPIYECQKNEFVTKDHYLELRRDSKNDSVYSSLYPPDQTLYAPSNTASQRPLATTLCDLSDGPGLLAFFLEPDKNILSFELHWRDPAAGEAISAQGTQTQNADTSMISHSSAYLLHYDGMPYLQYKAAHREKHFYYMGNPYRLVHVSLDQSQLLTEEPLNFTDPVWDFLPLDTGDLLVLLVQETGLAGHDYISYPPRIHEKRLRQYQIYRRNDCQCPLRPGILGHSVCRSVSLSCRRLGKTAAVQKCAEFPGNGV